MLDYYYQTLFSEYVARLHVRHLITVRQVGQKCLRICYGVEIYEVSSNAGSRKSSQAIE